MAPHIRHSKNIIHPGAPSWLSQSLECGAGTYCRARENQNDIMESHVWVIPFYFGGERPYMDRDKNMYAWAEPIQAPEIIKEAGK